MLAILLPISVLMVIDSLDLLLVFVCSQKRGVDQNLLVHVNMTITVFNNCMSYFLYTYNFE